MPNRDYVIEVLRGGKPPVIPDIGECLMDQTVIASMADYLPKPTGDYFADMLANAAFYDTSSLCVGIGVSTKTLSKDETHHTYQYETGAIWTEHYVPTFNREATYYPVETPEQALAFKMPEFDNGKRFNRESLTAHIKRLQDNGFFVQGIVEGAWAACYYQIAKFETLLEWMLVEEEATLHLFKEVSDFSIKSAEVLLDCGVDCVWAISDMGTAISTLFSKDCFNKYMFPWLSEICKLCHDRGKFFHLHSHGHIQDFMDGIVEAGVDLLNPVGPSDYNDLAMFKEKWGDKISYMGGVSTTIAQMTDEELRRHVRDVFAIGRKGGRFFARTESGIPPMPPEKIMLYLEILKEERMEGYI